MSPSSPFTGSSATKLGLVVTKTGLSYPLQTTEPTRRRVDIVSLPTSTTILRSLFGPLDNLFGGSDGKLLRNNVQLDTYWAIRVIDAKGNAYYFDFPQSQCDEAETSSNKSEKWKWPSEKVQSITAEQSLGFTIYPLAKIEKKLNELEKSWGTPHYHFWHSQQFSIFLTLLILDSSSLSKAEPRLRELLIQLHEAQGKWQLTRHVTCMGGMLALGAATGGLGFVAWAVGSGSLISDGMANSDASNARGELAENFPEIRRFLGGDGRLRRQR